MTTKNSPNTTLAGQTGSGTFVGSTSPTITSPNIVNGIYDPSGNPMFSLEAGFSNAANCLGVINKPPGGNPELRAYGPDASINMLYRAKGSGLHYFVSANSTPMIFYSGTGYQHVTQFQFFDTAATRTVIFPDLSGTLLMSGQAVNRTAAQSLTTSGTYTATSGTLFAVFEMISGGGSGGGTGATGPSAMVGSAGGGGGGYIKLFVTAAQIALGITYTIGAGGAQTAAAAVGGNAGGSTTLTIGGGTVWTTTGGGGGSGAGGVGTIALVPGGAGGTVTLGTNGTVIYSSAGTNGQNSLILNPSNYNMGGNGGDGLYGVCGGKGAVSGAGAAVGTVGQGKGAGGGGSASVQSGGALPGSAGAAGVIVVTEYLG